MTLEFDVVLSFAVGEVGGNTLGFLGCQINSFANVFTAYSFNGALHSWHFSESNEWKSSVVPGGHFGAVEDLDWDSKGRYLITTSKDQTTRGLLSIFMNSNTYCTFKF